MITQPSHAALAGDLAARINAPQIPKLEAELVRAIALHDAGWGLPDGQAIMRSRFGDADPPQSFLEAGAKVFLEAWTQSIEVVQPLSPAGGYIASRHFWRMGEHLLARGGDGENDRKSLRTFLSQELRRQKKLASQQTRTADELELLTDVLQFCDLLSLYICAGARESVQFPKYFGVETKLTVGDKSYQLDPPLIVPGPSFSLARLRHPALMEVSGHEMEIVIG